MQQRLNFWRSSLDRRGFGMWNTWDSTVGIIWQSPSRLSGIIQGSLRMIEPLMSSRNSHVVVSHEDGAIGAMSLYGYERGVKGVSQ